MIAAYMGIRMDVLQDAFKAWVNGTFDAPEGGAWRDGWEFYSFMLWTDDNFHTGMIERDIIEPAIAGTVEALGEVELTALLSWAWDEYLEEYNAKGDKPWEYDVPSRRKALASVLGNRMRMEAQSDGSDVEERGQFGEPEDEPEDE